MIKFLVLFFIIISLVAITVYENHSVITDFYFNNFVTPRSWGKIEMVQETHTMTLNDIFQSEFVWQALEQLTGFVVGVLVCVLIGWKVGSSHNFQEKSFENSLIECSQRQDRFEKQLSVIELQVMDLEKTFLKEKETASRCDTCPRTNFAEEQKETENEEMNLEKTFLKEKETASRCDTCPRTNFPEELFANETSNKDRRKREKNSVCQIIKQKCDEKTLAGVKTMMKNKLKKVNPENVQELVPVLHSDPVLIQEQDTVVKDTENEKDSLETKTGTEELSEHMKWNESESQYDTNKEELEDSFLHLEAICENSSFQLHACTSQEKLSQMLTLSAGGGESEGTFRGKIVPVSQIPQYQELRKCQRPKTKAQKEYEDEAEVPFITCGKSADEIIAERQNTPRNTSAYAENHVGRSTSKGGRRKQRS